MQFDYWGILVVPLLIFCARICDVSIGTVRIIFVAKGYRYLAPLLGFFEVFIWLMAMTRILQNLDRWYYYLAYCGGFATGNFIGILLEERIAIGYVAIRVITRVPATELIQQLHDAGHGVTSNTAQIRKIAEAQMAVIDQEMKKISEKLGVEPVSLKATDLEKKALAVIPVPTSKVKENGYGGYAKLIPSLTREQDDAFNNGISDRGELQRLCNGKHNVLQIKHMLDTQSSRESDIQGIMNYLEILKTAGLVTMK